MEERKKALLKRVKEIILERDELGKIIVGVNNNYRRELLTNYDLKKYFVPHGKIVMQSGQLAVCLGISKPPIKTSHENVLWFFYEKSGLMFWEDLNRIGSEFKEVA